MHLLTQDEIINLYADIYNEATRIQKTMLLMIAEKATIEELTNKGFAYLVEMHKICRSTHQFIAPPEALEGLAKLGLMMGFLCDKITDEKIKLDWVRQIFTVNVYSFTDGDNEQDRIEQHRRLSKYCGEQYTDYSAHATSYDQLHKLLCEQYKHALTAHYTQEELSMVEEAFDILHDVKNTYQMRLTKLKEHLASMERVPSDEETSRLLQEARGVFSRQEHTDNLSSTMIGALGLFAVQPSDNDQEHQSDDIPQCILS